MEATLDVWELAPESARHNHPAPFPVELPQRLIGLYTYRGDLVVDPFMGSGTTLVAAARSGRRYLGYDTDPGYVSTARARLKAELGRLAAEASNEPKTARAVAEDLIIAAGFRLTARASRLRGLGTSADLVAADSSGRAWYFQVPASFAISKGGLSRTETVWGAIGRASVMAHDGKHPVVLLTSELPSLGSQGDLALRAAGAEVVFDVIGLLSDDDRSRLKLYSEGGHHTRPEVGFWTERDLARP